MYNKKLSWILNSGLLSMLLYLMIRLAGFMACQCLSGYLMTTGH